MHADALEEEQSFNMFNLRAVCNITAIVTAINHATLMRDKHTDWFVRLRDRKGGWIFVSAERNGTGKKSVDESGRVVGHSLRPNPYPRQLQAGRESIYKA